MTRIRNFYFRLSRWHEESIAQTPSYCHVVLTQRPIIHYRVSVQRLLRMKVALPRQYTNIALGYVMLISTSTNAQYEQHRNTNKTKPQNPIRPSHTLFATNITRHTRHWTTHGAAPLFAACLFFFLLPSQADWNNDYYILFQAKSEVGKNIYSRHWAIENAVEDCAEHITNTTHIHDVYSYCDVSHLEHITITNITSDKHI